MTDTAIEIDLARTRPYEAGAILLAILALPEEDDSSRSRLIFTLCHLALQAQFDLHSPEALVEQPIKPIYAFRPEVQMRRDLRTFDRRLRDRLVAADIAHALLKRVSGTLPASLPSGLATFSLNELSAWADRNLPPSRVRGGVHEASNTEARIWRPSLPVIHIAAALGTFTQALARNAESQLHPLMVMLDPRLLQWLADEANRLGDLIENAGILGKNPAPLIRIQLR